MTACDIRRRASGREVVHNENSVLRRERKTLQGVRGAGLRPWQVPRVQVRPEVLLDQRRNRCLARACRSCQLH